MAVRYMNRSVILFVTLILVLSLGLLGCPKKPDMTQAGPGTLGPAEATTPEPQPAETQVRPAPGGPGGFGGAMAPGAAGAGRTPGAPGGSGAFGAPGGPGASGAPGALAATPTPSPLKDAFFDYDRASIRDDQRAALSENVAWLKANPRVKVTVEGHCDERGTAEYNLGLGERRAKAVKDYLLENGISGDRIATISYGKERPFVLGHDESAWKWNRRGHFMATGQ